jgi:hypothetical protein
MGVSIEIDCACAIREAARRRTTAVPVFINTPEPDCTIRVAGCFVAPAHNDAGTLALPAFSLRILIPLNPHLAIFTNEKLIVRDGSVIDGYRFYGAFGGPVSINDAGTVVF